MSDERPPEPRRARGRRGSGRPGRGPRRGDQHKPRGPKQLTPEQVEARQATRDALRISYPDLPVSDRRDDIAAALASHQVVVVAGETGSGKTTQLPKIALELGRGVAGTIGHTQPRRIAARAVADRIAEELGVELGQAVGYQVRFTDRVSATSLVKVMTDGILLAEIQRDPELRQYDTIIVDEAHERSLNIDFILGYLRRLLPRRPDLKVVITSATIDTERFAGHFRLGPDGLAVPDGSDAGEPAPIIEVSGRTYPVEIRYRPLVADQLTDAEADDDAPAPAGRGKPAPAAAPEEDVDQPTAICLAVDELVREGPGDILVFCSGEREIRDAADALREHLGPRFTHPGETSTTPGAVEVLPLYARLSAAEQHRVFESHRYRRVVLSTNVAETSLTVPGIHYVVDTGYARVSRYSHRTKVQRLPIEPVSQASANQRSGRSGRVADGIAIRLYSENDFERRPEFTEPEILRTSLASVILQMAALGLGRMEDFPFVEPPELRAIRDGVTLLTELGAIDDDADGSDARGGEVRLTRTGRVLAQLPIDPRLGRMLIEADRLGVVDEVMVIVSALSAQDVRERPLDAQQQADEAHRRFVVPGSDLLALVVLWDYLQDQQSVMGSSAFRRTCRREYLHFLRVREWQDVHAQLRQLAAAAGIRGRGARHLDGTAEAGVVRRRRMDADGIHQAVLSGLLSHVGSWDERRREYAGARGARFVPWPGSSIARKPPAFVMAAELVETSRLFGRQNARIEPEWAEKLAPHLVKRTFSEPYWSSKQGAAMCHEKVTLFGVPIVADRIVPYARVEPELAREMFIRHALVEEAWTTHHRFAARNRELRADAAELAERTRRLDLLADEETLVDFFDERLPEHVTTARAFDAWWKDARRATPDLLAYDLDLLVPGHAEVDQSGLPALWRQSLVGGGEVELPLTYQFTPGQDADGVTVHVPLAVLPRLRPDGFDWLVPELLPELATATIRALPKQVRVQLVPAPDTARAALAHLPAWSEVAPAPEGAPSFVDAFAAALREVRGVVVDRAAFDDVPDRLPSHLRMTFRVLGERGAVLGESADLAYLQRRLAAQSQAAVQSAVRRALRDARTDAGPTDARAASAESAPGRPGPPRAGGLTTNEAVELDRVATWADLTGRSIPREVSTVTGGLEVTGYPALVVERRGDGPGGEPTVALRVLADAEQADASHAAGVRELLLAELALTEGRVTSRWTGREALTLAASPYRSTADLVRDVQAAAIAQLTAGVDLAAVRGDVAYRTVRSDVRDHLEDAVYGVVARVVEALVAFRELEALVKRTTSMALLRTLQEVREHAASLVYPGFVARTPPERLRDLVRYLRADASRVEKAAANPSRDATLAWEVEQLAGEIDAVDAPSLSPVRRARVAQARWQLEELRVSLFAQQLGTRETVSAKRIRKALAEV
ncbi:MAG: ATP-dependent RNA helicase HrpA [Salana multivorans]|uniref:ATP-dependent RNA helicase HrpA n=1 Tax=Salana multivorans TaxID=120377 RepID=UPI00095DCA91|nr:ATP-dependent RNA helicase HrpA [Salana multivorans]MBN8881821.1 ATP-dependent RNA helicase HrpA [Salana multivorans]OJX96967.1 MAG: ATP-dependent RNA helicase HrpA [Micrococcales bacterium 73-15]